MFVWFVWSVVQNVCGLLFISKEANSHHHPVRLGQTIVAKAAELTVELNSNLDVVLATFSAATVPDADSSKPVGDGAVDIGADGAGGDDIEIDDLL